MSAVGVAGWRKGEGTGERRAVGASGRRGELRVSGEGAWRR